MNNLINLEYVKECNQALDISEHQTFTNKNEIVNILLNCIEKIDVSDSKLRIDFNKTLIVRAPNVALVADELNIQLAGKRVELQPRLNTTKKLEN